METIKSTVDIERSLIKTYRRDIYKKFVQGVNKYELISPGDKIAVAISGGKDSLTLAKLLQELKRHNKVPFDLEFIAMDPGYLPENRERLEFNCEKLGIPVKIHNSDVFSVAEKCLRADLPAICARECAAEIYTTELRNLVATSLPLVIILTMS